VFYDNNDVVYEIPIDITDSVKTRISELKEKSLTTGLTNSERIELNLTESFFERKGGKWVIHQQCTEYEYNLYHAIKYICPMYSVHEFCKIVRDARYHKYFGS